MPNYTIGDPVTFKISKQDQVLCDFLNVQPSISKSIKYILNEYIKVHGVLPVLPKPNPNQLPPQSVIEQSLLNYLHKINELVTIKDCYENIASNLQLNSYQLSIKSPETGENSFKKKVRFSILRMKKKGYIINPEHGKVAIDPTIRSCLSLAHMQNLDTTLEAMYINSLINKHNNAKKKPIIKKPIKNAIIKRVK